MLNIVYKMHIDILCKDIFFWCSDGIENATQVPEAYIPNLLSFLPTTRPVKFSQE